LKLVFSVMGWTSRTRFQHAFQCSASSRIGGRRSEAITTTWPLPIDSLPGRGSFPADGFGAFLCLPCGGAPSVRTIVAQKTFAFARGTSCPSIRCASLPKAHLTLPGSLPSSSSRVVQRSPPPSTSPSVSTPSIRGRFVPPAREIPRSPEPSASGSPALRAFRPRGFAPPRRLAPPTARRLVASCYRPWGSSGFRASPSADWPCTLPLRCYTLQSLSTCKAASLSPGTVTFLPFQVCVPSCGAPVDFKVLLRASVRSVRPPLPDDHARSSHGLPAPEAPCSAFNHALRAARRPPEGAADAVTLVPLLPAVLGGRPQLPSPAPLFDQLPRGSGSGRPCRRPRPPTLTDQLDIKHRMLRLMACLCHVMPDPCASAPSQGLRPRSSRGHRPLRSTHSRE